MMSSEKLKDFTSDSGTTEAAEKWFKGAYAELQKDFEIIPGLSWIEVQWSPFGVGCRVCRASSESCNFNNQWEHCGIVKAFRRQHFERHAASIKHRRNLRRLLADDTNFNDGLCSPTAKETTIFNRFAHPAKAFKNNLGVLHT